MAAKIGLRVYRISVHPKGNRAILPLDSKELKETVPQCIRNFISKHAAVVRNDEKERSWYFDEKNQSGDGRSKGYIHYGTFGFESNFVDNETKKTNYRRQTTDIEEIPLFYEFWCPENGSIGFVVFQSFQGRSCISLVLERMKDTFERKNHDFILDIRRMLPNDPTGSAFRGAPVKRLRLIKRGAPSDIADRYFDHVEPATLDLEVVMTARRNGSLGKLGSLFNSIPSGPKSVITHSGIEFPEAVADIRVGSGIRKVSVLGVNGDAGVIDLTDVITRGVDGHPTFKSLEKESDVIIRDFYQTVIGDRE